TLNEEAGIQQCLQQLQQLGQQEGPLEDSGAGSSSRGAPGAAAGPGGQRPGQADERRGSGGQGGGAALPACRHLPALRRADGCTAGAVPACHRAAGLPYPHP
ncbi:hypothetical protein HaLaN_13125, partial [Haematococcus lacustris]